MASPRVRPGRTFAVAVVVAAVVSGRTTDARAEPLAGRSGGMGGAVLEAPEVRVLGRGIVGPTGTWTSSGGQTAPSATLADYSDTAANLALRQRAGKDTVARFAVGALAPSASPGDVFLHRLYGTLRHRSMMIVIGRLRLPTRQLMFPTLRDDDLISATDLPNPLVAVQNTRPTHYGSVAALRLGPFRGVSAWFYAESLDRDDTASARPQRFVDRVGADVVFEREEHGRRADVDHVALGTRWTWVPGAPARPTVMASATVHGSTRRTHFLEMRVQSFYTGGERRAPLASRAPDLGSAASLRYLHQPERAPRFQAAVVVGLRRSLWREGGTHATLTGNLLYRVAPAVDLGLQAQEDRFHGSLTSLGAQRRTTVQLALVVSFDVRLVGAVDEPATLLDLEHAHIP